MWMMGYNEGVELSMVESFNGRRLRPLMPRPAVTNSASTNNTCYNSNPTCFSRTNGSNLLALNHHFAAVAEQSRREYNAQQVVVSSRWNPTPEQLETLEELYRRGTRTPSADQIQHITAQLARYGKIEGKNVFYWFQNHKARERQKRRRQLESASYDQFRHVEGTEKKESGSNKTFEVEQTKNWPPSTSCSSTVAEEYIITTPTATKLAAGSEFRVDIGGTQFQEEEEEEEEGEEEEQQQRIRDFAGRNCNWEMMKHMPSCSPLITSHLISPIINSTAGGASAATPTETVRKMNIFVAAPYAHIEDVKHLATRRIRENHEEVNNIECQTLQLFPMRSEDGDQNKGEAEKESEISYSSTAAPTNLTPGQFFEFLPLKN